MLRLADDRRYLYQWDTNAKIIVDDDSIESVEFQLVSSANVLTVKVENGLAEIPNILLQNGRDIVAYATCIRDGRWTKETSTFTVRRRSKPADYIYTETEIKSFEELEHRIDILEEYGTKITVDDELSEESENPIQNKAVTEKINEILEDVPKNISQLTNDSNFQNEEQVDSAIRAAVPTKTSQLTNDNGFLTSVPNEYITETELEAKKYLTSVPSEYVTETELNAKGYLTQHQDLSDYALKNDIPTKTSQLENDSEFLTEHQDLTDYALKENIPTKTSELFNDSGYVTDDVVPENVSDLNNDVGFQNKKQVDDAIQVALQNSIPTKTSQLTNDSGFLTQHQDLSDYALNESIPTKISQLINDSNYASKNDIPTKTSQLTNDSGFLTQHQDLSDYAKKEDAKPYTDKEIAALSKQIAFVDVEDNEDVNDPYDGGTIVVDSELSLESENPVQNKVIANEFNKFSGTVEITSGNPEKENTVLTLDPSSESVNIYTAEETDAKLAQLSREFNERFNSIQDGDEVMY